MSSLSGESVQIKIEKLEADLETAKADLAQAKASGDRDMILMYAPMVTALENRLAGLEARQARPAAPSTLEPPKFPFSSEETYGQIYGVDLQHPDQLLPRQNLVKQLIFLLQRCRHVLLYSPPSTGKTSLTQLVSLELKKNCSITVVRLSCGTLSRDNCFKVFSTFGLDLEACKTTIPKSGPTLFILDDCHEFFGLDRFWDAIIRNVDVDSWCHRSIKFLFVATQLLYKSNPSHISFQSLPKLTREDFLISREEAHYLIQAYNCSYGDTFNYILIEECSGVIGLITGSLLFLKIEFRSQPTRPTESDVLCKFYSEKFTHYMTRSFSFDQIHSRSLTSPAIDAVTRMLSHSSPVSVDQSVQMNAGFAQLEHAGIIIRESGFYFFSSPYAKRFVFNYVFPNRSLQKPSDVTQLILKAIQRMSNNQLQNSVVSGSDDFPKEAAFQHLFLSGLAAETPPSVCICSELGKRFPATEEEQTLNINGEIDFYIDGDIRWGIELLTKGDRLGKHLARCRPGGKYAALDLKDYAVVDFRRGDLKTLQRIESDEKRVTVLFPLNSFKNCNILIGCSSQPISIYLKP